MPFGEGFYHGPVSFRSEEFGQPTGGAKQDISQARFKIRIYPSIYRDSEPHLRFVSHFGR